MDKLINVIAALNPGETLHPSDYIPSVSRHQIGVSDDGKMWVIRFDTSPGWEVFGPRKLSTIQNLIETALDGL